MRWIILFAAAMLVGCAPVYHKDGVTPAQTQKDLKSCRQQAIKAMDAMPAGKEFMAAFMAGTRGGDIAHDCMVQRGYRRY